MGLIDCLGALSGAKNKSLLIEDRQELHRRAAELTKTMPRAEAEVKAVEERLQHAKDNHEYLKTEIEKELPEKEKRVKAPETPDNAVAEVKTDSTTPRVIARDLQPKDWQTKIKEALGVKDTSKDSLANKFLSKAHSLLGKMSRAGDTGAYSKFNTGRVSAEAAAAQGNNTGNIVSQALAAGHMVIDKMGRVKAVEDIKNNIKTLNTSYKTLRNAVEALGYTEKGTDANDPNTITNATAMALYGPRLEALVKAGQFDASNYTAADKAMSEKLRADPTLAPHIKEFHDIYNHMRSKAIDAMVASGLKTEAEAKAFMDRAEYLPLYRMDAELQNTLGEPATLNSLLSAAKEHHLGAGSTLSIGDAMENAFNNLTWLNTRAVKNNTANILAESLVSIGSAKWQKQGSKSPDVLEITRNGESVFLKVDDVNDTSAFLAAPVMTGFGWKLARQFTNVVRRGVTIMPGFVWGQTSQDAQRVAVMTGQSFTKAWTHTASALVKGVKGAANENPEQQILRSYGVVAARDYVDGLDTFRKEMLDKQDSKWYDMKEYLEQMASASDGAARETAYKKRYDDAVRGGMSVEDAQFEAQHAARMLIDFNNKGNSRSLAALMTVVPFVNARIQGTHRMVDALMGKIPGVDKAAAQKMAMMQVGKLMAFTLAYTLVKQDDDEYENQTQVVRNNNFMFPGGLKMPVAGELLPFKVLAETAARQMLNDPHEDWSKSKDSIRDAALNVLMGPSDMVPTFARPFLESATNHSFSTGHELISQSLQNLPASEQYTSSSTSVSKALSKGMEEFLKATGLGGQKDSFLKGVSPIVLENFLNGFTGRTGQETLNIIRNMESIFGARPGAKRNEIFLAGAAFTNPEGGDARADFQEVANRVASAQATLKHLKDEHRGADAAEFIRENQQLLSLHGRITPIQQQLTAIKHQLTNATTTDQRTALYQRQLQVLRQVMDLRKRAGF